MRGKSFSLFGLSSMVAVALCGSILTDSKEVLNSDSDSSVKTTSQLLLEIFGPPPPVANTIDETRKSKCKAKQEKDGNPNWGRCRQRRAAKLLEKRGLNSTLPPPLAIVDPKKIVGTCGLSNPGANAIGPRYGASKNDNKIADFGEFPWMIAVLKRSEREGWIQTDYLGGGSLIHPMVVVTVAHLIRDPKKKIHLEASQIKVRAGEWATDSEDELYDPQDRNVAKVVVHEHYFRDSLFNDIGLLFLVAPVILEEAPHIGVGCLAPQLPPPGTICFSMGWGIKDFSTKKVYSSTLKKIKLPLLGKEKCEEYMRKTRFGPIFELHRSLVCAGGEEGIGNCRGDRGSSLVCPIVPGGSRFAIYGMYAYTLGCGVKDIPGIYVNVPDLYQWVGQQLSVEGYSTDSYTFM